MDWASIHANPAMTPAFMGLIRTPADKRNMAQIEASAEATGQQFQVLEQGLKGRDYVAGKSFTMGDIVGRRERLPVEHARREASASAARRELSRAIEAAAGVPKHVMKPLT